MDLSGTMASIKMDGKRADYTSPYLTCESCNGIVFVDADRLRSHLGLRNLPMLTQSCKLGGFGGEPLPQCSECQRTTSFRIGACDLTRFLATSAGDLKTKNWIKKRMVVRLQRAYRLYLSRQFGRAQRHAKLIREMLHFRCASTIQSMVRLYFARRRRAVEQALLLIKNSRPKLLERALDCTIHPSAVFWYNTKDESDVLFSDYYLLVERIGTPLHKIEENILCISKRITDREFEIVRRVQTRWRGLNCRWYYMLFLREICRIREIEVACAIYIQRKNCQHGRFVLKNDFAFSTIALRPQICFAVF